MALEKKRMLRKIEFTCTDDCVHQSAHAEYRIDVLEDEKVIASTNHREVVDYAEAKNIIDNMQQYAQKE